jgi:hypothetical protein
MTRPDILARIAHCIEAVSGVPARQVTERMRLGADCKLTGRGLLQVGELMEERFATTIQTADLLDVLLRGGTVARLVDLIGGRADA